MKTIDSVDIQEMANEFGTPTYIYDRTQIEKNYHLLNDTFTKYYQNTHIHYAVKANTNPHILSIFKDLGAGADCSSPIELFLSKRSGINDILYTGNYESPSDLASALEIADHINLDDISSLDRLLSVGTPEIISFRINPGIGRGGFEGIVTGGTDAKFGIPYEKTLEAYKKAKDAGVKRFGIHMMTGSNNLEPYHFSEVVEKLMNIAGSVFNELGIIPEYIDIGGGFGIPYYDEESDLNLDLTAKLVADVFSEKCEKYGFGEPKLILEPGRFLVGNAGYLLTKVTAIKESYKKFIGLDAGMNTLLRPALYGAFHRIETYSESNETEHVNVCGQICENSDIFAKNIELPKVSEGELVVFKDAGAYGYVMSSNYNNRLRPAEVLIENRKAKLIRKRETLEDTLINIT
jgi:diaminopimelate decarboxylase